MCMVQYNSLTGLRLAGPDGRCRSGGGHFGNVLYRVVGIFSPDVSVEHTASIFSVTQPVDALRSSTASQHDVNPLLKMTICIMRSLSTRNIQGQRFGIIGRFILPLPSTSLFGNNFVKSRHTARSADGVRQ